MKITVKPYTVTQREFFTRVIPVTSGNAGKLNSFVVYPHDNKDLYITETTTEFPEGLIIRMVGFTYQDVAYWLEKESGPVSTEV